MAKKFSASQIPALKTYLPSVIERPSRLFRSSTFHCVVCRKIDMCNEVILCAKIATYTATLSGGDLLHSAQFLFKMDI